MFEHKILHYEKLRDLYQSLSIVKILKSRRLRRRKDNIKMDLRHLGYGGSEVNGTGSGSCPMTVFGVSGFAASSFDTIMLVFITVPL